MTSSIVEREQNDEEEHRERVIHYTVDGEPQSTNEHVLTPTQILKKANIDPSSHYLIQLLDDNEQKSYKDDSNVPIHMHEGMRFLSASSGPTTVSQTR